jgi:hypothetical protein
MENQYEESQETRLKLLQLPLIKDMNQDFFRPVTLANIHSKDFTGICYVAGRTIDDKLLIGTYSQPENTILHNKYLRMIHFNRLNKYSPCGM